MMKHDYINGLKDLLDQYEMDSTEKTDILSDYEDMYDSWLDKGMTDEEVEEKLGKPKYIIKELTEGLKKKSVNVQTKKEHKLVALMPFICVVLYMVLGFGFNMWHPGWIVFLLIPVSAIILETDNKKNTIIALSPFTAVIGYLYLGFFLELWHPGWLIFLIIPLAGILFGSKQSVKTLLVSTSPFLTLIAYFVLGHYGYYHPGWLVFLLIPVFGVLHDKNTLRKYVLLFGLLVAIFGYLYLYLEGYTFYECFYSFIPLALILLYKAYIDLKDMSWGYRITIVGSVIGYVLLGYYFNLWGFAWLLFLSIPMHAIVVEVDDDDKLISLMPFICVILFFSLGWFLHLWAFSWLVFLLIPVVAILKE